MKWIHFAHITAILCVLTFVCITNADTFAPSYSNGELSCWLNVPAELAIPDITITSNITAFAEYIIRDTELKSRSTLQTTASSAMDTEAYANGGMNYLNTYTKNHLTRSNDMISNNHLEHEGSGAMMISDEIAIQNYHTNTTWMNGNVSYPYAESYEASATHFGDDGVLATDMSSYNSPVSDYSPTTASLKTHVSNLNGGDMSMGDSVITQRYNGIISAGSLTNVQELGYNEVNILGGNRTINAELGLKSRKQTYGDSIFPFNASANISIDPNLTSANITPNITSPEAYYGS